ncbi:MAG: hypothetical protein CBC79_00030 [Gammaproteobacteria bacterium TMED119]|nr:MAG: hypothetical protein CBC79_00030 [Gammaproteobacteria bacterium TMED119]|tara:strand:+ start:22 stop:492 length:471 start_codon:yes stop_codon:yes gene_type:complete
MNLQQLFIKVTGVNGISKFIQFDHEHIHSVIAEEKQDIVITSFAEGKEVPLTNSLAIIRSGADLIIRAEGGAKVKIIEFASTQDIDLYINTAEGEQLKLDLDEVQIKLDNGDAVVHLQGEADQLMQLVDSSYREIQMALEKNNKADPDSDIANNSV